MNELSSVEMEAVPARLREREQWVCWRIEERDGKETKVPVNPETGGFGSATDAVTWTDVETTVSAVESGEADGVGFVFSEQDSLVVVDLDDCRDPESGVVDDVAADIIERLDSYTEVSPSGTGFHVLVEGSLPDGRNRRGSVECYETAWFFTVTGDHVEGTPGQVVRRQDALRGIHRDYVQPDDSGDDAEDEASATADAAPGDVDLEDEELVEKGRNASNGSKFERLWNGRLGGYESQSEADMAFCCLLAFWSGGDESRMDRLFRESGLMREKWDEVHYADGATYGEKTIERAVRAPSEFYDPDAGEDDAAAATPTTRVEGRDEADSRSRAYLAEKNRVLADRVDDLEATLDAKSERIEELSAEVERLKAELEAVDSGSGEEADRDDVDDESTTSIFD